MGRLTHRDHLDAGTTQYTYDPAGNVTAMTNAAGETVTFVHHYNRLTDKHYPRLPQNDVHYIYNIDGHVSEIHDASGFQQLSYDNMGRVSEIIRTFAVPFAHNTYTFTMEYEYDSWNRMLSMTYPDGERVAYAYDLGGQLKTMTGQKGPTAYRYINDIQYDRFGSRTRIDYGNGTYTCYTYDDLQRLETLRSYALVGNAPTLMQDIQYTLDDVGNISDIDNTAPAIGTLGGTYRNNYTYDDLYRLESAVQQYGNNNSLAMGYSPSGRLCTKVQSFTSQHLYYGYDNVHSPHAPRRIFNVSDNILHDLQWDANGNLAQVNRFLNAWEYDGSRYLFCTEDNRLTNVVDEMSYSYYAYDHSGERTLKITGENTLMDVNADMMICQSTLRDVTLYTSPYLVAGNHGYTKHYYAGTERVCARIGGGGLDHNGDFLGDVPVPVEGIGWLANSLLESCNTGMQSRQLDRNEELEISSPCKDLIAPRELTAELDLGQIPVALNADISVNPSEFESAMINCAPSYNNREEGYFYHSDHLGSASWITDNVGEPVQHLQYLPYGEPFVNQRTTGYNERFTFTGKELDSETGYSYFGARYLDHELMSMWLSVDPMADKYPSINPYAYCAWNPVKLVDPEGMIIDSAFVPKFVKCLIDEKNKKYNSIMANLYRKLDSDPLTTYRFIQKKKYDDGGETLYGGKDGDRDIINIFYSKGHILRAEEGNLLEETFHAYQFYLGEYGFVLNNDGDEIIGMEAFDMGDEVNAKVFAAQNVNRTTGYEKKLLETFEKEGDYILNVRSFLERRADVDFNSYENLSLRRSSINDNPEIMFHDDGRAYHPIKNIIGRRTR
jgi:RHS repeat-associated protein